MFIFIHACEFLMKLLSRPKGIKVILEDNLNEKYINGHEMEIKLEFTKNAL